MPRYYIGLIATKSQMGSNTPGVAASGSSRPGVKTTTASSVNDATHSYGWLMSNLFPGGQVVAKNPAGTLFWAPMVPLVSLHYKLHHAAWYIRPDYFQSVKAAFAKLDFKSQDDMEKEARDFLS